MNILMEINTVFTDSHTDAQVVILRGRRYKALLPIWVGAPEANAIRLAMEHVTIPRPLTHDLLKSFLTHINVQLKKAVIRDVQHNTYYASLYFKQQSLPAPIPINPYGEGMDPSTQDEEILESEEEEGTSEFHVDARPSDAIVLSLRYGTPLYVSKAVLEKQKTLPGFQEWFARVNTPNASSKDNL